MSSLDFGDNPFDSQFSGGPTNASTRRRPGRSGAVPVGPPQVDRDERPEWEDEPPLLEELGIDFHEIISRSVHCLKVTPLHLWNRAPAPKELHSSQADLSGPLCIAICLGLSLLLSGKIHFGYVYGCSLSGSLGIFLLLNIMGRAITLHHTVSILGYGLLPILLLSLCLPLTGSFIQAHFVGLLVQLLVISWCTSCATAQFVSALTQADDQYYLIAFPVALLYGVFALITVF